jgi:hypothetical protein
VDTSATNIIEPKERACIHPRAAGAKTGGSDRGKGKREPEAIQSKLFIAVGGGDAEERP